MHRQYAAQRIGDRHHDWHDLPDERSDHDQRQQKNQSADRCRLEKAEALGHMLLNHRVIRPRISQRVEKDTLLETG